MAEVIDRLHADDYFSRQWGSYDPPRADGTQVLAREDGCIVFPNAAALPVMNGFILRGVVRVCCEHEAINFTAAQCVIGY